MVDVQIDVYDDVLYVFYVTMQRPVYSSIQAETENELLIYICIIRVAYSHNLEFR